MAAFEPFRPEIIRHRQERNPSSMTKGHTLSLAHPPSWTATQGIPCQNVEHPAGANPDQWTQWDTPPGAYRIPDEVAAAMCAGCPVLQACRADALANERGDANCRDGIRGGLSPHQRAQVWFLQKCADKDQCPPPCGRHQFDPTAVVYSGDRPRCAIVAHLPMPEQCISCAAKLVNQREWRAMSRPERAAEREAGRDGHDGKGLCIRCHRARLRAA
jgi:hypothetical protein